MAILKGIEIALLGLLPSLIWLGVYLRRARHPEPRRLLVLVFLLGFIVTPFIGWLELCMNNPLSAGLNLVLKPSSPLCQSISLPAFLNVGENSVLGFALFFGAVALIEEVAKYLVVRLSVVGKREFDEPKDAMVYLIVAALGFAASENVFAALNVASINHLFDNPSLLAIDPAVITVLTLRFGGATLLHTLSSGILGYWLAKGYFHIQSRRHYYTYVLPQGLLIATLVHAAFNLFINMSNDLAATPFVIATAALLIIATIAVFSDLRRLQQTIFVIR